MQWVKASELKEYLGSGFSPSTIKRRRQEGIWKEGKHYRRITPSHKTARYQYNTRAIQKDLNQTAS